ncbi:MAG: IclR family transcriptional regulator [Bacillota bacterium]
MGKNTVKSVVKAMNVFEELVNRGKPVTLSLLSKSLGLNISTVHRLLNTLLELGYVEQNEDGLYKLGLRSYKLADLIYRDFDLRKLIHPYLEEIVDTCNETTNFVIMEDFQVVYIDQVESTNMVRMFAGQGSHGPAYCTGSGKALLANLEPDKRQQYLKEAELTAYTENTITDTEQLRQELARIREQGYALDLEEMEKGVRCVAAPIFGEEGDLQGAISVSGPCTRITREYLGKTLIPLIRDKTEEISGRLQS